MLTSAKPLRANRSAMLVVHIISIIPMIAAITTMTIRSDRREMEDGDDGSVWNVVIFSRGGIVVLEGFSSSTDVATAAAHFR